MTPRKEQFLLKKPQVIKSTEPIPQKIRINFKPLRSIFYLLLIGFIVYFLFFNPLFEVRKVETEGIISPEISDYLKKNLMGKNILLIRIGKFLGETEKRFSELDEAKIVRGLPSTVNISAKEKKQVLIWCNQNCFEVDDEGFAYQQIDQPGDKVFIKDESNLNLKIGERVVSPQFITFFLKFIEGAESQGVKITEGKIGDTTYKLTFKTADGFEVILDTSASLKNQLSALKQVLEKNRPDIKEYVDLRIEGVAYIK